MGVIEISNAVETLFKIGIPLAEIFIIFKYKLNFTDLFNKLNLLVTEKHQFKPKDNTPKGVIEKGK